MVIQLKRILCAIDFSRHTPTLLRYSAGLAKRTGARLLVFHVVHYPEDDMYTSPVAAQGVDWQAMRHRAASRIDQIMEPYDVNWAPLIHYGNPVDQAPRVANESDADLVMAVSHGFSKLKRLLWGTVVERMARELNRPLLVIRSGKRFKVWGPQVPFMLNKIIVGCDLSSEMRPVLAYTNYLARMFNAEVHLLHTMETPVNEALIDKTKGRYGKVQQRLQQRIFERLSALYADQMHGHHHVIIKSGLPEEALVRYARQQLAELMIVGVKWHGVLNRYLVGSTTEAVIRHSPCPVLVVPPDGVSQNK